MSAPVQESNAFYDQFYAKGGWKYDPATQRRFLLNTLAPLAGWNDGARIIEVGAGTGTHAEILRQAGYRVTALEASTSGARYAWEHYPDLDMICADAATWFPMEPGYVYARGMSWWHYELDGVNCKGVDVVAETAHIFEEWVAPGATFTLQIVTDFSGSRPPGRVHFNTKQSYLNLFSRFGSVKLFGWDGRPIVGRRTRRGVIAVTTKPEG